MINETDYYKICFTFVTCSVSFLALHCFTEDDKFGQKMLENMGWSRGKGLGANEDGITDHINVKVKSNKHGMYDKEYHSTD